MVQISGSNGGAISKIRVSDLVALGNRNYVCGLFNGTRFVRFELTVPPDVAYALMGEKARRSQKLPEITGNALHTDSSATTIRQHLSESFPCVVVGHHAARCSSFGRPGSPKVKAQYV
jgi:hypothetical protein